MEGSLSKWTNMVQGWQYRWFVLDENAGLLSYYTVSVEVKTSSKIVIKNMREKFYTVTLITHPNIINLSCLSYYTDEK